MEEYKSQSTQPQEPVYNAAPEKDPWEKDPWEETAQQPIPQPAAPMPIVKENVLAGVVGAFLFALLGGALYFIIYQFGYIAGICGLITVILSTFGYQLFSGKKNSVKGVVIAVIMSLVAIFLGEFMGLAYDIYKVFKTEYEITFFDAVRATPSFLTESKILTPFLADLGIGYALGALASFANIRNAIVANKQQRALEQQQQQ